MDGGHCVRQGVRAPNRWRAGTGWKASADVTVAALFSFSAFLACMARRVSFFYFFYLLSSPR